MHRAGLSRPAVDMKVAFTLSPLLVEPLELALPILHRYGYGSVPATHVTMQAGATPCRASSRRIPAGTTVRTSGTNGNLNLQGKKTA
jgi:hypothetical protein